MIYTRVKPGRKSRHATFFPPFENLFNEVMRTNMNDIIHADKNKLQYTKPATNVQELPEKYVLEMSVPGISKKELSIDLDKNQLTISVEREESTEVKFKVREFNYNKFSRSFSIPEKVDKTKISAQVKLGILTIELPKKEEEVDRGPQNIKVQ